MADRGYVLETGRVILQGSAAELLENKDVQRPISAETRKRYGNDNDR